jgi:transcriptional regulator with XRE-family HTH domain
MAPRGPQKPSDNATRAQALALLSAGLTLTQIGERTGYNKSTISRIEKKAKERGYDPEKDPIIYTRYVEDGPRMGRPKKCTLEEGEKVYCIAFPKFTYERELSI